MAIIVLGTVIKNLKCKQRGMCRRWIDTGQRKGVVTIIDAGCCSPWFGCL